METFKIVVMGEISQEDSQIECHLFSSQSDAIQKFGSRIGEVFATHLGEEGSLEGELNISFTDFADGSGEDNPAFHTTILALGSLIESAAIGAYNGTIALFHNDRNNRIGAIVLLWFG